MSGSGSVVAAMLVAALVILLSDASGPLPRFAGGLRPVRPAGKL